MAEFNNRAKANFEVKVASLGALDAVKQQKARLCPLVCGKGFKVEEDRCVAEACKRGFVRNKATGECMHGGRLGANETQAKKYHPYWSGIALDLLCEPWGPMTEADRNEVACRGYGFYPGTRQYDECMKYVESRRSTLTPRQQ